MNIGQLKHYVALQNYSTSRNSFGEIVKVWTIYANVWASIEDTNAQTKNSGEKEEAETSHKIRVRYNGTISEQDRVIYGSRTFEVVGVINDNTRKTYQLLLCKSIYPETQDDKVINAVGHLSELCDYAEEAEGYVFLDVDNWLLYTRNSTEYNPSEAGDCTSLFTARGSYTPSTALAFTSTIYADGSWDGEEIPLILSQRNLTITKVVAACSAGTITFNLEEREEITEAGTEILSSDLAATTTGASSTAFANPTITHNNWIVLTTGVGAASVEMELLTVVVYYSVGS